jgi:tetratricopeptide (TPR) repeat protein
MKQSFIRRYQEGDVTQSTFAAEQAYAAAAAAFQAGRWEEAERHLAPFLRSDYPDARLHGLAGFTRRRSGNAAGAEAALKRAGQLAPKEVVYTLALGDLYRVMGRHADAEAAYLSALSLDSRNRPALIGLGACATSPERLTQASELMARLVSGGERDHALLAGLAQAYEALRAPSLALETYRLATEAHPTSGVAQHNLAAAYADALQFEEALAAVEAALNLGQQSHATWLVKARALQGLNRLDEAEAAYGEALARGGGGLAVYRDLSQLVWMRTGSVAEAGDFLRHRLAIEPDDADAASTLAKLHQMAGDLDAAGAVLDAAIASARTPNPFLHLVRSDIALAQGDVAGATASAEAALKLAPEDGFAWIRVTDADLAAGRTDRAAALMQKALERDPDDVAASARLATAWRLTGDPRYAELYDYANYVRAYRIDTPAGWATLEDYLVDLRAALTELHGFQTHPFDQSLRHGSQTSQNLERVDHPAVRAFFKAIDGPIRRHMEHLRQFPQGLGRRYTGDYMLTGSWSVFLRPNGFHVDHIHPMGWLSSAFYVETPETPSDDPHAGWIKFGEPGQPTTPKLAAEHYVKPEPGTLVLFPSHMWHGTVPFTSDERRITIAFDIAPALLRA